MKALILALLLTALPLSASAQTFSPLAGRWEGTVEQPGAGTYPVVMVLVQFRAGATGGIIEYPSLHCGGRLQALAGGEGEFSFREVLEWGLDRCINNGTVRVALEEESLSWRWYYPDGRPGAAARLRRDAGP